MLLYVLKPENGYPSFATITRHSGQKITGGKLWMRGLGARLQKQMKAGAEKISFFEKHKRHSKTLRKERMLKQDENALQIYLQGRNICVAM